MTGRLSQILYFGIDYKEPSRFLRPKSKTIERLLNDQFLIKASIFRYIKINFTVLRELYLLSKTNFTFFIFGEVLEIVIFSVVPILGQIALKSCLRIGHAETGSSQMSLSLLEQPPCLGLLPPDINKDLEKKYLNASLKIFKCFFSMAIEHQIYSAFKIFAAARVLGINQKFTMIV